MYNFTTSSKEKGRYLTNPMTKSPTFTNGKLKSKVTTQKRHQNIRLAKAIGDG